MVCKKISDGIRRTEKNSRSTQKLASTSNQVASPSFFSQCPGGPAQFTLPDEGTRQDTGVMDCTPRQSPSGRNDATSPLDLAGHVLQLQACALARRTRARPRSSKASLRPDGARSTWRLYPPTCTPHQSETRSRTRRKVNFEWMRGLASSARVPRHGRIFARGKVVADGGPVCAPTELVGCSEKRYIDERGNPGPDC